MTRVPWSLGYQSLNRGFKMKLSRWILPVLGFLAVEFVRELVVLNCLGVEPGRMVRDVWCDDGAR